MTEPNAPTTLSIEDRVEHLLDRIESKSSAARWWDNVTKAAAIIVIPVSIWLVGLEVRVSQIESNRFTPKDGVALHDDIMASLPPLWLKEDIKEIKEMLRDYDKRMRVLETKK